MPLILIASIAPISANAGIFSFLSELFTKAGAIALTDEKNSQTVALLQSAPIPDTDSPKGGGEITVIEGKALLSENGPEGTIADISESKGTGEISLYVVRPGDNLSSIAVMFDVSVNTIIWANELKRGAAISPGQTLVILPITGVRHTVKPGETLASIAKKYGSDEKEIIDFNEIVHGQKLVVGQEIIVPDGEIAAPKVVTNAPTVRPYNTNGPNYEGYYMHPLPGGRRTQGLHGYNGVDIADVVGTPVLASASGLVIISKTTGWNGGYGQYIVVEHANGTQTLYAHLSANIVGIGTYVSKGQIIGLVGNTGKSTGPHLHFEVRGAKNPF